MCWLCLSVHLSNRLYLRTDGHIEMKFGMEIVLFCMTSKSCFFNILWVVVTKWWMSKFLRWTFRCCDLVARVWTVDIQICLWWLPLVTMVIIACCFANVSDWVENLQTTLVTLGFPRQVCNHIMNRLWRCHQASHPTDIKAIDPNNFDYATATTRLIS